MKVFCALAICILAVGAALGAATNSLDPAAQTPTIISVPGTETNAAGEKEYERLQGEEDFAQGEVARWIAENHAKPKGTALSEADLERRVHERLEPVRKAYDDFVKRHPKNAQARLDYGSFLNELH